MRDQRSHAKDLCPCACRHLIIRECTDRIVALMDSRAIPSLRRWLLRIKSTVRWLPSLDVEQEIMFTAHQFTVFQLHKPVGNLLETAFSALSWLGQQCRLIRRVLQHALFLDLFLGLMLREVWRHRGIYIWVCLCQMTGFNETLKPWLVMWVYCSNKDVGNKSSLTF